MTGCVLLAQADLAEAWLGFFALWIPSFFAAATMPLWYGARPAYWLLMPHAALVLACYEALTGDTKPGGLKTFVVSLISAPLAWVGLAVVLSV